MENKRRSILKHGAIDIGVEKAALPNGVSVDLAVIRHPGASAIVALHDDETISMIHQWRHAVGGYIWEIPAGVRRSEESSEDCAARELGEEAGLAASRWDHLGSIVTIPSFCNERIELYLARQLTPMERNLDHDEVIRVERVAFAEAIAMIKRGDIIDAKTIAALYHTRDLL